MKFVLSIDQGTTSSRAILFDQYLNPAFKAQKEFRQLFPKSGWVEHDPDEIWKSVVFVCKEVLKKANIDASQIISIGITNQRETTLVWEKNSGRPIHNAIVWQDRRTRKICDDLRRDGHEKMVSEKTGLLLDPYFSATKIKWLIEKFKEQSTKFNEGEYIFGTVDTFLIWRLTNGRVHATDATNASRTMLYDIEKDEWSKDLCDLMGIPKRMLPRVLNSADDYGMTCPSIFGVEIPINGIAGDQHAATIGQACFEPGMVKSTYGTGCFAMVNTGKKLRRSRKNLLSTIAYKLEGKITYALEGSIFVAGAVVQWLRDGIQIIDQAKQSGEIAVSADPSQRLYLVPAFTGLGAPYWDSEARGAIFGLTRNSGRAEISRAALESVGFQTLDLLEAMKADIPGIKKSILRVDGGMSASNWTMQFISDILGSPVDRPKNLETTALGAAWLAGMHLNFYPSMSEFSANWSRDVRFEPRLDKLGRQALYDGWKDAVSRTLVRSST